MDHPFRVGQNYSNRNGRYQVLAIQEPKMLIRYEDGREQIVDIVIQARIWQSILDTSSKEAPGDGQKSQNRISSRRPGKSSPRPSKMDQNEKLVAEILETDEAIFEILTRLTIPPGQIDLYRLFLRNPDDYFSQQQIANAVRESYLEGQRGVFMAFGRRIGASPDARVRSLKPFNRLFFHHKRADGKTLLRIRHRIVEIFQSYPKFHEFLLHDNRSWLPDEFGATYWQNSKLTHETQMRYFGLWDRRTAGK